MTDQLTLVEVILDIYKDQLQTYQREFMNTAIDWTKPVITRDGRDVRILCTDGPNHGTPVVGFIKDNLWPTQWTIDGGASGERRLDRGIDLRNKPELKVHFKAMYKSEGIGLSCDYGAQFQTILESKMNVPVHRNIIGYLKMICIDGKFHAEILPP